MCRILFYANGGCINVTTSPHSHAYEYKTSFKNYYLYRSIFVFLSLLLALHHISLLCRISSRSVRRIHFFYFTRLFFHFHNSFSLVLFILCIKLAVANFSLRLFIAAWGLSSLCWIFCANVAKFLVEASMVLSNSFSAQTHTHTHAEESSSSWLLYLYAYFGYRTSYRIKHCLCECVEICIKFLFAFAWIFSRMRCYSSAVRYNFFIVHLEEATWTELWKLRICLQ